MASEKLIKCVFEPNVWEDEAMSETMWVEIIEGDETQGIGRLHNNAVGLNLSVGDMVKFETISDRYDIPIASKVETE